MRRPKKLNIFNINHQSVGSMFSSFELLIAPAFLLIFFTPYFTKSIIITQDEIQRSPIGTRLCFYST